jgi:hypothetical protein
MIDGFGSRSGRSVWRARCGAVRAGRMCPMATPSPPRRRRRWPLALAVAVLGAAVLAITVTGMTNPWRYTALFPLESPVVATVALVTGAVLLGVALVLATARLARGAIFGWILGLAVLAAVCFGLPWFAADRFFGAHTSPPQQLAVSPDGAFEIVKSTVDSFGHQQTVLALRSRAGLLSRESPVPLAECGHDPFGPEMAPESVRFTSRNTVAIPVEGESTMTVTFDDETLRPARTIQMGRAS